MDPNAAVLQREPRSSIELTRNAKGDYQWVIKIYFDAETDLAGENANAEEPVLGEAKEALRLASAIDTRLRAVYLPSIDVAA